VPNQGKELRPVGRNIKVLHLTPFVPFALRQVEVKDHSIIKNQIKKNKRNYESTSARL
jgi:hypothetical protein